VVTRNEKREQAIRRNPNNVRFDDMDLVLIGYGFNRRNTGTSHFVYIHPLIRDHVNVVRHGATIKPIYVKKAVAAIDAVIAAERSNGDEEETGTRR
jgi:hypothetical protein